jgi:hypothetical protein
MSSTGYLMVGLVAGLAITSLAVGAVALIRRRRSRRPLPGAPPRSLPRPVDLAGAVPRRTPLSALADQPPEGYVLRPWPHQYRPRTATLRASLPRFAGTLALDSAAHLMRGDLLRLESGEVVEVIDHPDYEAGTVAVRRGVHGTPFAPQFAGTTVTLIGNSQSGTDGAALVS